MAAGELRAWGGKSATTLFSQCLSSGGNGCRYPPLNTQSGFSKGTMSKFILHRHTGYRTLKCICSPWYRNITFNRRLTYWSKTWVELRGRMRGRAREWLEMLLGCDGVEDQTQVWMSRPSGAWHRNPRQPTPDRLFALSERMQWGNWCTRHCNGSFWVTG